MVPVVPPLKGNMAAQDLQKRYFGVLGLLHFIYNENPDLPTAIRLAVGDVYSPSQQDVVGILDRLRALDQADIKALQSMIMRCSANRPQPHNYGTLTATKLCNFLDSITEGHQPSW